MSSVYGKYPTPNDVKIFINGTWIDDAYRIDIDKQAKKIPLTGYSQRNYALVAMGKKIVIGNIIIHYRFPGYLIHAIAKVLQEREDATMDQLSIMGQYPAWFNSLLRPAGSGDVGAAGGPGDQGESQNKLPDRATLLDTIRAVKRMGLEDRARFIMASHEKGYFDQSSAILDEMFATPTDENGVTLGVATEQLNTDSPEDIEPESFVGGHAGFDMDLYYGYHGSRQQGAFVTETVRGVHIIGRRKVLNASTSGGDLSQAGQSVLEVYPFFASDVSSRLSNDPPTFIT